MNKSIGKFLNASLKKLKAHKEQIKKTSDIVAQTDFLVIVPRQLGMALAKQEHVQMLEPPRETSAILSDQSTSGQGPNISN